MGEELGTEVFGRGVVEGEGVGEGSGLPAVRPETRLCLPGCSLASSKLEKGNRLVGNTEGVGPPCRGSERDGILGYLAVCLLGNARVERGGSRS